MGYEFSGKWTRWLDLVGTRSVRKSIGEEVTWWEEGSVGRAE